MRNIPVNYTERKFSCRISKLLITRSLLQSTRYKSKTETSSYEQHNLFQERKQYTLPPDFENREQVSIAIHYNSYQLHTLNL